MTHFASSAEVVLCPLGVLYYLVYCDLFLVVCLLQGVAGCRGFCCPFLGLYLVLLHLLTWVDWYYELPLVGLEVSFVDVVMLPGSSTCCYLLDC